MLLVLAAYLLLCLPVCIGAEAFVCEYGAGAHVFVGVMGVGLRADLRLARGGKGLYAVRLYEREETDARKTARDHALIRHALRIMAHASDDKRIAVSARVGAGDAMLTALAAGAVHSAACAAAAVWMGGGYAVRVVPVYDDAELCLNAVGIFKTTVGDIMHALARAFCAGRHARRRSIMGKRGLYGAASD